MATKLKLEYQKRVMRVKLLEKSTQQQQSQNIKSFFVYENQRWWLDKGWAQRFIPGDNQPWSDIEGQQLLLKDQFELPNMEKWCWLQDDWEIS